MIGIDMNQPIEYYHSSMRYFKEGEHHITRNCYEDVLVLVYEGVLRFEEDGVSYEIHPGQYHIQKQGSYQQGLRASSSPRYLYVHFKGNWVEKEEVLPAEGKFSCENMFELMKQMDHMAHNNYSLIECSSIFYQILSLLYQGQQARNQVNLMADYIMRNIQNPISLEILSEEFGYSKNHIINLFKKKYKVTPIEYLISKRLDRAEWLLESTGDSLTEIAEQCGFSDYVHFYKVFVKRHRKTPSQWRRDKIILPYGEY